MTIRKTLFKLLGHVCIFIGLLRHNWAYPGLCWRIAASVGELVFIPLDVSLTFDLSDDDPRLIKIQNLVERAWKCYLDQDEDFAQQYVREINLLVNKLYLSQNVD
jgi:hypothetical protein